jgi:hypothetical protein
LFLSDAIEASLLDGLAALIRYGWALQLTQSHACLRETLQQAGFVFPAFPK